jgi:phosphoribosylamine--glycine ligase
MKLLVIGGGGREHAIVWKLQQSALVEKTWCAPGNGGISELAECLPLDLNDVNAAADLAAQLNADLTIVGPELPLVLGIADTFAMRGLALLGPSRSGAQLEGSKVFAKKFMERHRIPTAGRYGAFDSSEEARKALDRVNWPVVIKADGLCAGKGVLVTSSRDEASDFVSRAIERREFGSAGESLLFEQGLRGEELSYIILTDGENFIPMAPARDHKRAYDNDEGPNTGGMGAYSIDDLLPAELEKAILDTVVGPTLQGLRDEGISYRGFLYFGLMLTAEGPKVLEYNCRLGDPETEAILLRTDFDMAGACLGAANGNLANFPTKPFRGASACVVLASEGYPSYPMTGREISGLDEAPRAQQSVVFHAGTRREGISYYSTGGRVLVVAAEGTDLDEALRSVYERIGSIRLEGSFYRKDIGAVARRESAVASASLNGMGESTQIR